MLRLLRVLGVLVLAGLVLPAVSHAGPRQVRLALGHGLTLERVQAAGLDIVEARPGLSVDVLEWPGDAATIAALGAGVTVVDDDPGLHMAQRARAELAAHPRPVLKPVVSAARADGVFRAEAYPPEGSGSLGGFWTLAEVKMKLDDLVASDSLGIVADKLDTVGTSLQGRPIWGLKLGTTVGGTDTRPVAYFSALTHAREPGGMQALFHFVDDLLGRYTTDPVARYLLENRQIYLCPVVNPDGYAFNERIYDSTATFGLWRKNLRDNNANGRTDTNDGVDVNRNYGYKWGYDNVGSSGTQSNDAYRGTAAWSEPETRVQRDLVAALKPTVSFSFHTYSDLFVHPWGWTSAGTPDSSKFQTWSDEFTITNGFVSGPAPRILYSVNGEYSDWMYGDTLTKPKAFSWTPEVGLSSDGFWPPPSRMPALNASMLRPCWQLAGIAGPWVRVESTTIPEGQLDAGNLAHLVVHAKNYGASGLAGPGLLAALTPLDAGVGVVNGPLAYPAIGSFQGADPAGGASFTIFALDSVTPGRLVRFRADFTDDSGLFCSDTVSVIVGTPTVLFLDAAQSLAAYTRRSGTWGVVTNDANHPDAYVADSPAGIYTNNFNAQLRLNGTFDLSAGPHAWALFEDRYAFEQEFDAGLFEASTDTVTWAALPGNGAVTTTSANIAGAGKSIFGGTRWHWRQDRIDLSAFAGDTLHRKVWLRWRSLSDPGMDFDGMNFDSLRVLVYDPSVQPAPVPTAVGPGPTVRALRLAPPAPNPAHGPVAFALETPESGTLSLDVLDVQGRVIYSRSAEIAPGASGGPYASRFTWGWDLRDRAGRAAAPGVYLVRLRTPHASVARRLVVLP